MKKENKIENSLIVPEKENILKRFFKWVRNIFTGKSDEGAVLQTQCPSITIPKAVKMPIEIDEPETLDENSLEYLSKLSDTELDDLDKLYDQQLEEAQNEILRLDNMLQTYKQSIKKLQGKVAEEDGV